MSKSKETRIPECEIIEDYPEYIIFPNGTVCNTVTGIVLKATKDKRKKSMMVSLRKNGVAKQYALHILVARYFVPNPNPRQNTEVSHKNKDITDNRAENLEWVPNFTNALKAIQESVLQLSEDKTEIIARFDSITVASRMTGFNYNSIRSAMKKGCNVKGYKWVYESEYNDEEKKDEK